MFGAKVEKPKLVDGSDFIVVHPLTGTQNWTDPYYQIAAIDPGKKNLALVVERRYHSGKIETVSHMLVELDQHTKTENACIHLNKTNVKGVVKPGKLEIRNDHLYLNVIDTINRFRNELRACHWILIEKQLNTNTDACVVMSVVLSTVLVAILDAPTRPYVALMCPMLKTRILAPGTDMNKPERKKWAVGYALDLVKRTGDTADLALLTKPEQYVYSNKSTKKTTKKDDLSDVKCMVEAFCVIQGYPLTPALEATSSTLPVLTSTRHSTLPNLEIHSQQPKGQLIVVPSDQNIPRPQMQFVIQGQVQSQWIV